MRIKSFATLGTLALLAAASAFGQQGMTANIPFEFHFGTAVMPAGQYRVNLSSIGNGLLQLSSQKSGARVLATTFPGGSRPGDASREGALRFNKYGDRYFLSSVWLFGDSAPSALRKSKAEGEIGHSASLAPTSLVVLARR